MFYTACRETGDTITWFDTIEEAREAIKYYEQIDKNEGYYTEDFYCIQDENRITIE